MGRNLLGRVLLREDREDSYSAGMYRIWLLALAAIVVTFCIAAYLASRSWQRLGTGKRILGLSLLAPHFLIIVCIVVSLFCGHPPQGSARFNTQFMCGILALFILPLPALAGTIAALTMFIGARSRTGADHLA
jgi:hypothetical protein